MKNNFIKNWLTNLTTGLPESRCILCFSKLNAAGHEGTPTENDLTVCENCGNIMKFDKDLNLAKTGSFALYEVNKDRRIEFLEVAKIASAEFCRKYGYKKFSTKAFLRGEYDEDG